MTHLKKILVALGLLTAGLSLNAQPNTPLRPQETVLLYANQLADKTDPVKGSKITAAGYEMTHDNEITDSEEIGQNGNLGKISKYARFDLYFPENPNGQMVVVCPGGGYAYVSSYNEGVYVADWMLERGITVAVVKYRMPEGHWNVPLEDVQNTFRYCRAHAREWGVSQIGVMGFSAGGHLAVTTATMYADAVTRPDFSIFIYPVVSFEEGVTHQGTHDLLIGKRSEIASREGKSWDEWSRSKESYDNLEERYSLENQVSSDNAPVFLALCTDDGTVIPENSIRLYRALVANGVSTEMHIFPQGGHGWGFSAEKFVGEGHDWFSYARPELNACLERWLKALKAE